MKTRQICIFVAVLTLGGLAGLLLKSNQTARLVVAELAKTSAISREKSQPLSGPEVVATPPAVSADSAVPQAPTIAKAEPLSGAALESWVDELVTKSGPDYQPVKMSLPDGREFTFEVSPEGSRGHSVMGRVLAPSPGNFVFSKRIDTGKIYFAVIIADDRKSYIMHATSKGGKTSPLVDAPLDQVICATEKGAGMPPAPPEALLPQKAAKAPNTGKSAGSTAPAGTQEIPIPEDHPIPPNVIPDSQNGVIPLQSNPGAAAVLLLDFDGHSGPHAGWQNFEAAPAGFTNAEIRDIWQRCSEGFITFGINVTTDAAVFAAATHKQRCIITTSQNEINGIGGIAYIGSFGNGESPCWVQTYRNESGAAVIVHEVGHTLGLGHDGVVANGGNPAREYLGGEGTTNEAWAPWMGAAYVIPMKQWSKGEYPFPSNTQDDIAIISAQGPAGQTAQRADQIGNTIATAEELRVLSGGVIDDSQIIESRTDKDFFHFRSNGGLATITFSRGALTGMMNCEGTLYDSAGTIITTSNAPNDPNVTLSATLVAGDYYISIDGAARTGVDSFTDYGSIGSYNITGTIAGAIAPQRFTVNEGVAPGTAVGTVIPRQTYTPAPTYSIQSGNTASLFVINATTGAISIAPGAVVNYETLAANWRNAPEYLLRIQVTNGVTTESAPVFVAVLNLNEAPTLVSTFSADILNRTAAGAALGKVVVTDPDLYTNLTYSITAGDPGGGTPFFTINPDGTIRAARQLVLTDGAVINLSISVGDGGSPALIVTTSVSLTVKPNAGQYPVGTIKQVFYNEIFGANLSDLYSSSKYPSFPDKIVIRDSADWQGYFDNNGNYGSTMRGVFIAPSSGNHQFWISGDDQVQLYISPDVSPTNATLRASASPFTNYQAFDEAPSQATGPIAMVAGQPYFFEARVKQGSFGNHLSIGWQEPGKSRIILPARYVAPVNSGIQLRYTFNGNATDSFGSGDAKISGSPTYVAGTVQQAIDLTGGAPATEDFLTLPYNVANTTDISVATWINWDGGNDWQRVFDFGNGTDQYLFLSPRAGGAGMRFRIHDGATEQDLDTTSPVIGQWTHIAVTLSGTTGKLYVNGVLKATNSSMTLNPSDFNPLRNYIGKSQYPDPYFNGRVDDFRVYGRALTQVEVTALLTNNQPPTFTSPTLVRAAATRGRTYTGTIAGTATDPDNLPPTLVYAKVSGPPWLKISSAGLLSGTPGEPDIGTDNFTVSVADPTGNLVTATLQLPVNGTGITAHYQLSDNVQERNGTANGVLTGTGVYGVGQNFGRAITMDGTTNFVTLPTTVSNYTNVTYFVRFQWNGNNDWQRVFDFGNGTNQGLFLTPRANGSGMRFRIYNNGTQQDLDTTEPGNGQWVNVAVTIIGNTGRLYVNGALAATNAGMTLHPTSFNPVNNYLGKSQYPDPLFNGKIDDFRIYNRGLTAFEIARLADPGLDTDGDGIVDSVEGTLDLDVDTIANYLDLDSDADSIPDSIELYFDTDNDSIVNALDTDSDNDSIPDATELYVDTDNDGIVNALDLDSDNDGILDSVEGTGDSDSDSIPNYRDTDSDNDGILDSIEGTSDPDGDGIPNYRDTDSDNDGMPDSHEANYGFDPYLATDATGDEDGDTQSNLAEYIAGTDPYTNSDFFKVLSSARNPGDFTLTVQGVTGRTYILQRSADLSGTWSDLSTQGPLASDAVLTFTDASAAPDRDFYRVVVSVP